MRISSQDEVGTRLGRVQTAAYETFRKQCRATVGSSPAAFRLARRIEAAQALLRMSDLTHAAIAASLGFADEYHFAKRFRERVGVSPRDYRGDSA